MVKAWIALAPAWLERHPLNCPPDASLNFLDPGEREAIALALELGANRLIADETVPRIFTRMPRARIACSADVARCCSQENFFRQDAHNLRVNLIAGGNHVFIHRFFKRQRRRAATFRKLKRGNPDVCVDDDDHPLDRTLRRRGFFARTSLMSRGTSASV